MSNKMSVNKNIFMELENLLRGTFKKFHSGFSIFFQIQIFADISTFRTVTWAVSPIFVLI